jgi:RNA polymerase sigma factor (TIGR02999 family)
LQADASITVLLQRFSRGDKNALDTLVPLLYPELRRLARGYMRKEDPGHTLQPTAVVHEAYARLVKQQVPDFRGRAHFMAVAAQIMRQILIDHARVRHAAKRGGGAMKAMRAPHDAADIAVEQPPAVLAVDDALQRLFKTDSLKGRLIELRFFGGLTADESAEVLNIPVVTVRRQLRVAQAWLQRELAQA